MKHTNGSIKSTAVMLVFAAVFFMQACSSAPEVSVGGEDSFVTAKEDGQDDISSVTGYEPVNDTAADENEADASDNDHYDSELTDKHVRIRLQDSGNDIFTLWGSGRPDYRYGPSIITDGGKKIDAWFSFPGDSRKEYDWISYRHSDDGGMTWNDEKVVLTPTPGSMDRKSVCDPDVIYHDGYYYLGYTGTINTEGLCNSVFLARSEKPDGPYEKWDGTGWGKDPIPVIYYNGVDIGWGCGEPSFVIVDNRIFIYSTLDSFSSNGWIRLTRVHTADLTDPMWPAKLHYEGTCVIRTDAADEEGYTYSDSDSWDVAYLEDSHKFIALATNRRFFDDSCLLYYESYDGINFTRVSELNTNVICGCHNCGLSADRSGHIGNGDDVYIGYAYSGSDRDTWGVWATRLVKAKIDYSDTTDRVEDSRGNLKQPQVMDGSLISDKALMLLTDQTVYTAYRGDAPIKIRYYLMNGFRNKSQIDEKDVHIEKYDQGMFELSEDNRLIPVREGSSNVRVEYMGLRREICVRVLASDCDEMKIRRFYPVCRRYDIKVNEPIILKVRPVAEFEDYELTELTGLDYHFYDITFRSSDITVCRVADDGTISPISPGSCVISVEGNDCRYTVEVYVTE